MAFVLKAPASIPYPSLKQTNEKSPGDAGRTRKENDPIPHQTWLRFYLAAENWLVLRAGFLSFGHDQLRAAIYRRWLESRHSKEPNTELCCRKLIVRYFWRQLEKHGEGPHAAEEIPWQNLKMQAWQDLRDCLTEPYIFLFLVKSGKPELRAYWSYLIGRFDVQEAYESVWQSWSVLEVQNDVLAIAAHSLGSLLADFAYYNKALPILRRAVGFCVKAFGQKHEQTVATLTALGECARCSGLVSEAENTDRLVLKLDQELYGLHHPELVPDLLNLAAVLVDSGRKSEAHVEMEKAFKIHWHPTEAKSGA